ncbi:MAG: acetylxylan esterase, partial [Alphaproteobacteria bacterium]|nr:acetylxylan esterase [Alphaproteobacteria bacterium]
MNWTAEQDQANMLKQLGITKLRPGRNNTPGSPDYANYDESKANPYPNIPDALVMNDGRKVTSPDMWWKERRPELVEMFEKDVYGRVPENLPPIHWTAIEDHERIGFTPVDVKDLTGTVDNSSNPSISVKIHMTLVLPAHASHPVPVLIMFGRAGFPNPAEPNPDEMAKIDQTWKDLLIKQDPALKDVFAKYPAWHLAKETPFVFPQLNADGGLPNDWQLVGAGWGYVLLDPTSVQADNGAGLTRGIIGLANHGQPRTPDQWGALRAWAWGASRALDYLETQPGVDAKHVGIDGVSRYGKAALVTMAFDQRFAMVLVGSSGKGGATLFRRSFGEAVENLTGG